MNKTLKYRSEKNASNVSFQDRFSYTPKPGISSKENILPGTFPSSHSQLCRTSGQQSSRNLSNLAGREKNCPPPYKHVMNSSIVLHDSDTDQYMDHMIEEEAGFYKFLEGEDVDDSYDAFSPLDLDAKEHCSAMQPLVSVDKSPSSNCNTFGSVTSAGVANQTLTSQRKKKLCDDNRMSNAVGGKCQSKAIQMKLPFAGRKRLIDDIFDIGEETHSGSIVVRRIESSTTPHHGNVLEADVAECDGNKVPAFLPNKHPRHASSACAKPVEESKSRLQYNHPHHDLSNHTFVDFPPRNTGSRQDDNQVLADGGNSDRYWLTGNIPKQFLSGLQRVAERNVGDTTLSRAAMESLPVHTAAQYLPPGPTPCSFFTAGPCDR